MVGLVTADGRVLATHTSKSPSQAGLQAVQSEIVRMVQAFLAEQNVASHELRGIGVTVPGMADPESGVLLYAPAHGWRDVAVKAWLQQIWPELDVFVDNDVNAAAWGEYCFGAGVDAESLLWITVSTGIGGGLVLQGQVYRGADGLAGEIGHVVLEEDGPLCGCGQCGCLEAVAAGPAIARRAKELLDRGSPSALSRIDGRPLEARDVAEAARRGDALAHQVMTETVQYLGRAVALVANVLNPQLVVFGGGVSQSLDLEAIEREAVERCVLTRSGGTLRLCASALGYEASLIGAGALVHCPQC